MLMKQMTTALRLLFWLALLTGLVYPLTVTGLAQVLFSFQANGSLIVRDGQVVGSSLMGQAMSAPGYFWPRPSAIAYNPAPSSGSNLGPTSAALAEQVRQREAALRAALQLSADQSLPADLLFASGSGLDPHISPQAAQAQIRRVAQARGLSEQTLAELVAQTTEGPQFGWLGPARVNVLWLNLALDALESK